MVGFSIGNKGYMGTGIDATYTPKKDFWEYDPATNVWTQKADFPGATRQFAAGFSMGGKAYIGIGSDGYGRYYKDFWEYDPAINVWTRKADFGGTERLDGDQLLHWREGVYRGRLERSTAALKISGNMILPPMPGHKKPTLREEKEALSAFPSAAKATFVTMIK